MHDKPWRYSSLLIICIPCWAFKPSKINNPSPCDSWMLNRLSSNLHRVKLTTGGRIRQTPCDFNTIKTLKRGKQVFHYDALSALSIFQERECWLWQESRINWNKSGGKWILKTTVCESGDGCQSCRELMSKISAVELKQMFSCRRNYWFLPSLCL